MHKTFLSITAFAAVILGATALVASARRPSSTSTTAGTAPSTTPDPQDPDDTTFTIIGRIDLTQIHTNQNHRRCRIRSSRVS